MRLFVAVTPPSYALAEIDAASAPLQALPESEHLRWTGSGTRHLTLVFLGEVEERRLPELTERLGRLPRHHHAPELCFSGAGRFGDRVLWVRVQGERTELRHLAGAALAAAKRTGISVEERDYKPHLTLARTSNGVDLRPFVNPLRGFEGTPWLADHVALMRSHLGRGPARYEELASWTLAPA